METSPLLQQSLDVSSPPIQRRLISIEPVLFLHGLYMFGSGPLLSQFVHQKIKEKYNYNATKDEQTCSLVDNSTAPDIADRVQAEASDWLLYLNIAAMVPALVSTLFFSSYSKQHGRKAAIISPLVGAALRIITCMLVIVFDLNISLLIISSVVDGICGMSLTMMMGCFSYLTDVTTLEQRSFRIVILTLCSGLASIVSDLLTGYGIRDLGFFYTFLLILVLIIVDLFYVVFLLPESLVTSPPSNPPPPPQCPHSPETIPHATSSDCARINRVPTLSTYCGRGTFLSEYCKPFQLYISDDGTRRRSRVRLTAIITFFIGIVQFGLPQVQTLFMLRYPYCFSSVLIGYFYAGSSVIMHITNVVVVKLFARRCSDMVLVLIGCIFGISYHLVFGLSVNRVMLFFAPVAGCGHLLPLSLVRAFNSKIVHPEEVGAVFASIAWIETFAVLVGGTVQSSIYSASVAAVPYAVFLFGASVYALAAIVTACGIFTLFASPSLSGHSSAYQSYTVSS